MLLFLAVAGAAVGVIGTLVGAGGGFLIVPLLVLGLGLPPALAAGTSMVMVTCNAMAGTVAQGRRGRVDWLGGLLLAAAGYPGTLLGAHYGTRLNAGQFNLIFGLLLIGVAAWMVVRTRREQRQEAATEDRPAAAPAGRLYLARRLSLPGGGAYAFSFPLPLAVAGSFTVGLLGGMLGIGGGPLLVPFLIFALGYPPHAAAATSQLNIALTSIGAAGLYISRGSVVPDYAGALSLGVLIGSPVGAWLAARVEARNLVWFMSGLLFFLGIRLAL